MESPSPTLFGYCIIFNKKKTIYWISFKEVKNQSQSAGKKKRYFVRQFGVFMVYLRLILENEEYSQVIVHRIKIEDIDNCNSYKN